MSWYLWKCVCVHYIRDNLGIPCYFSWFIILEPVSINVCVWLLCAAAECAGRWGSSYCRRDGWRWSFGLPQRPAEQSWVRKPLHRGALPYGGRRVRLNIMSCVMFCQSLWMFRISDSTSWHCFLISPQNWPTLQLPVELSHRRHRGVWPCVACRNQPTLWSPTLQRQNSQEVNSLFFEKVPSGHWSPRFHRNKLKGGLNANSPPKRGGEFTFTFAPFHVLKWQNVQLIPIELNESDEWWHAMGKILSFFFFFFNWKLCNLCFHVMSFSWL